MNKAQERVLEAAMKAYPENIVTICTLGGPIQVDENIRFRKGFIKGYEQAVEYMLKIIKGYIKKGDNCMNESTDDEDNGIYTFWDGFHNCAENVLRELNDE